SNLVQTSMAAFSPQILAIVNQDGSANAPDHPAKGGSNIAIYVSGLGATTPLSVDGLVTAPPLLPVPNATVNMFLPGTQLNPTFVGAAPGMVAGITQINVTLPPTIQGSGSPATISVYIASAPLYFVP